MKTALSVFLILSLTTTFGQTNYSRIILTNGDTLYGSGRVTKKNYRFVPNYSADVKRIPFDEIDHILYKNENDEYIKHLIFNVKGKKRAVEVEETINNKNLSLYTLSSRGYMPNSATNIRAEYNYEWFYVRKENENELTFLGRYDTFFDRLKENVTLYFRDCEKLIDKIEQKEFKVRKHMKDIVEFYNEQCN